MNENEIQNDIKNTSEYTEVINNVQSDSDSATRVVYTDSAGENSTENIDDVIQGDSDIQNDINSNDNYNALTDNTLPSVFTLETNTIDYTETLTQIKEEISKVNNVISVMNNVVWLLYIFLLITWAEKKITVYVNRMTRERR